MSSQKSAPKRVSFRIVSQFFWFFHKAITWSKLWQPTIKLKIGGTYQWIIFQVTLKIICSFSKILNELILKGKFYMRFIYIINWIQFSFASRDFQDNAVIDETILHRVGLGKIKGKSSPSLSLRFLNKFLFYAIT